MRNAVIGLVVGVVVGIFLGASVIVPRRDVAQSMIISAPAKEAEKSTSTAAPESSTTASPKPALAPPPAVRWNMASAYAASLPYLGTLAKRVETEIWRVSAGTMEIRFHGPGALVPIERMFGAVSSGAVDAAFALPELWADRNPALQLLAGVPFGPSAAEHLAWVFFGGGRELIADIYGRHNIHGLSCGLMAPAAAGWFRKEIRLVDDLRGLKMRLVGLGAKVMEKLGARTIALGGSDIFVALETGAIDAAGFSTPATDLRLGFHQLSRHYYLPGWHQPTALFNLIVNRDKWEALPGYHRAQIEAVCGDNIRQGLAEGEAIQFAALKELQAKGVRLHRWPAPVLEALARAWQEVAAKEAAGDPDFRRVWKSLSDFRQDYAIWKELGYL